jgi:DNA-directed RNA polymerase subunit M/transcription elongation factor TFIIS
MVGKELICKECKGNLFKIKIGSAETPYYEGHKIQLAVFKCGKCGYEYGKNDTVLNTKKESVENERDNNLVV